MTPTTKPGQQHGARDDILGRIRRALAVPSRYGHGLETHAPAPKTPIAPDNSNPTGTNASALPAGEATRQEGNSIGIAPTPQSERDALEASGWVPDASSAKPMSIPLTVLNAPAAGSNEASWRAWLPPVGAGYEERVALLERNLLDLKAEFRRVQGHQALQVLASEMARENGWARVARHASPLLDAALQGLEVEMLSVDGAPHGFEAGEMESCEAGWTVCDALIAQTGTVLLSARGAGGRALSVLPPHHVVVATPDQLVPDLPAAFEVLAREYRGELPSSLSFITGASRTGDIERILVLGAHGPKRLTILLVE